MNRVLILLAILLSLTGAASGQAGNLPPCSAAQLAVTGSYMTDHFDLMGQVMTREMVATLSPAANEELGDLDPERGDQRNPQPIRPGAFRLA